MEIEVDNHCRICGVYVNTSTKKVTNTLPIKVYTKLCADCKAQNRVKVSEGKRGEKNPNYSNNNAAYNFISKIDGNGDIIRVKQRNPNHTPNIEAQRRYRNKFLKKERPPISVEKKKEYSERMKIRNPMFSSETRNKVSATFKQRIKDGIITYKRGIYHPLWKGNRNKNSIIRARLKEWRKVWLAKSNYTCEICNQYGEELEVHHVEYLRDIIQKISNKPLKEYDEKSLEFFNFVNEIVDYHKNIKGQVLCKKCHAKIDEKRKIYKNQIN